MNTYPRARDSRDGPGELAEEFRALTALAEDSTPTWWSYPSMTPVLGNLSTIYHLSIAFPLAIHLVIITLSFYSKDSYVH